MHRDPNLRKRNALVIPGVLIAVLSLIGMLYAQFLRPDTVQCDDGRLVVFANACRSAVVLLAIPFVAGLVLAIVGSRVRRPSCSLGHGTAATTGLALLATMVALPLLAALYVYLAQDPTNPFAIQYSGLAFRQARILGGVAVLALLAFVPYLALYIGTARPPRCCREKACFEPCYCDEPAVVQQTVVEEQVWREAAPASNVEPDLPASAPKAEPQPMRATPAAAPAPLWSTASAPESAPQAPDPVMDDWASAPDQDEFTPVDDGPVDAARPSQGRAAAPAKSGTAKGKAPPARKPGTRKVRTTKKKA